MAREGTLTDPVEDGQKRNDAEEQEGEIKALSIEALSLEDFKPVPVSAARQPHPFEGYPQKKIKIGTYKVGKKEVDLIVNATHIIALNPKEYVHQDPSGKNVSLVVGGKETFVNYQTSHNRIVRDQNGNNTNVVFDRDINLANGAKMSRCAICPDHTARAQLVFTIDPKTGKITIDRRYVLADVDQVGRLRKVFEMHHYQQTQSERLSKKFEEEPESAAQ